MSKPEMLYKTDVIEEVYSVYGFSGEVTTLRTVYKRNDGSLFIVWYGRRKTVEPSPVYGGKKLRFKTSWSEREKAQERSAVRAGRAACGTCGLSK